MNNKINKFLNSKNYRNNMKEIISDERNNIRRKRNRGRL